MVADSRAGMELALAEDHRQAGLFVEERIGSRLAAAFVRTRLPPCDERIVLDERAAQRTRLRDSCRRTGERQHVRERAEREKTLHCIPPTTSSFSKTTGFRDYYRDSSVL